MDLYVYTHGMKKAHEERRGKAGAKEAVEWPGVVRPGELCFTMSLRLAGTTCPSMLCCGSPGSLRPTQHGTTASLWWFPTTVSSWTTLAPTCCTSPEWSVASQTHAPSDARTAPCPAPVLLSFHLTSRLSALLLIEVPVSSFSRPSPLRRQWGPRVPFPSTGPTPHAVPRVIHNLGGPALGAAEGLEARCRAQGSEAREAERIHLSWVQVRRQFWADQHAAKEAKGDGKARYGGGRSQECGGRGGTREAGRRTGGSGGLGGW